ncbi:MAG: alginate export family protein [Deltaproteobacteria bacterium]|nr:alginate export family protein [Deltaproteobacteria bacterium]
MNASKKLCWSQEMPRLIHPSVAPSRPASTRIIYRSCRVYAGGVTRGVPVRAGGFGNAAVLVRLVGAAVSVALVGAPAWGQAGSDATPYHAGRDSGAPAEAQLEEARTRTQLRPRPMVAPAVSEPGWTIDLGGQTRVRGDFVRNQSLTDFTFTPGHEEFQLLQRTRLRASVENADLGIALFTQGQWYGRWGGTDEGSDPDLYQAYIEWRDAFGLPVSVRAGRQDFSYGSAFFLGANDFYNGLSWDGLQARIRASSDLGIDLIASRMVELTPGDPEVFLTGIYATYAAFEGSSLEGYFFHSRGGYPFFHREFQKDDPDQRWFTLGTRVAVAKWGFDAELEPQFQWGRVESVSGGGRDEVRAYGGHLDVGYSFEASWEPRVFAAYALGSGHDDISDGRYEEFHGNAFNDNYLVGDTGVVADLSGVTVAGVHSSGMHVGVAGVSVRPLDSLDLNVDLHRFVGMDAPSGFSSDLGVELNLVAAYQISDRLSVVVGLNRFYPGRFFRQAGASGRDVDYVYLQTQIEFGRRSRLRTRLGS